MDRGYAKFELFNRIVDAGSSYVCRIRDNSVFDVLEERQFTEADRVTEADRTARVLSDQIISLGSDNARGTRRSQKISRLIRGAFSSHRQPGFTLREFLPRPLSPPRLRDPPASARTR